jgi:hypothetical protein
LGLLRWITRIEHKIERVVEIMERPVADNGVIINIQNKYENIFIYKEETEGIKRVQHKIARAVEIGQLLNK